MSKHDESARNHFLEAQAAVDSHIHAGLRSAPQTKTYRRWNARELSRLQAERDAARAEYEPTPESRIERLQAAAAGHPDNASTQAAQRLLAELAKESQ